jgi:glycosyltransferase involved in cell wall biosynthesis
MKFSVIICTHNPREDYLRRVLAALQAQTLAKEQWELLLVDNASREPLAAKWDLTWQPNARHVREDKPGKTHALLRATAEAKGELMLIVDDDNVLRADYLAAALKISTDYPWLGAWSGSCLPEFETEPSDELRPWLAGLVIEQVTVPVWAKLRTATDACPMGAGMVVRQPVVARWRSLTLNDPARKMLGPDGKNPGAGDDADMALCGFDLGLGTGRFPELELTHLIPTRKLTLKYLERLHAGFGHAGVILNFLHQSESLPRPPRWESAQLLLKSLLWRAAGRGRVGTRIRVAEERGRIRAIHELNLLGDYQPKPAKPDA